MIAYILHVLGKWALINFLSPNKFSCLLCVYVCLLAFVCSNWVSLTIERQWSLARFLGSSFHFKLLEMNVCIVNGIFLFLYSHAEVRFWDCMCKTHCRLQRPLKSNNQLKTLSSSTSVMSIAICPARMLVQTVSLDAYAFSVYGTPACIHSDQRGGSSFMSEELHYCN